MAKRIPLDVAFSLVLKNPKVKKLRSGEFGAYVRLCHAAILDGKYPFPVSQRALAKLSGAVRTRWGVYRPAVMEALDATLPVLFERYAREKALQVIRSNRTARNCAGWHEKLRKNRIYGGDKKATGYSDTPELSPKKQAVAFADKPLPMNFQPQKANRFRPDNIDYQARGTIKANKNKGLDVRLTD